MLSVGIDRAVLLLSRKVRWINPGGQPGAASRGTVAFPTHWVTR
jgi:hypothetical protein